MAPVNGTSVANATCTAGAATTPTATSTSSPCTAYIAAPIQTMSGTTAHCCVWYTVESGDSCYTIDTKYGILLNQFRAWNPYINSACGNLQAGYAHCVFGSSDPVVGANISAASPPSSAQTIINYTTTSEASSIASRVSPKAMVTSCITDESRHIISTLQLCYLVHLASDFCPVCSSSTLMLPRTSRACCKLLAYGLSMIYSYQSRLC